MKRKVSLTRNDESIIERQNETNANKRDHNVFMLTTNVLSGEEAFQILINFDPKKDKHTDFLFKPKGGETYIFYTTEPQKNNDWRTDGYSWTNNGQHLQPKTGKDQVYKHYYKIKIGNDSSSLFKRISFTLPNTVLPIIIQYLGDEKVYRPSCHGNSKNRENPFEPTPRSVLEQLRNDLKFQNPNIVYKSDKQSSVRNLKQLQNMKYNLNKSKRARLNEICTTQTSFRQLDFVESITAAPDLIVIAYDKKLVEETNRLETNQARSEQGQIKQENARGRRKTARRSINEIALDLYKTAQNLTKKTRDLSEADKNKIEIHQHPTEATIVKTEPISD